MIAIHCSYCGYGMMFNDDKYGKSARCRKCKSICKVLPPQFNPEPAPAPAPAAAPAPAQMANKTHVTVQQQIVNLQKETKSKVVYFLFWFFLGGLGAHRFYAGEVGMGIALLCSFMASVLTAGLWLIPHMVWFIVVEGIILLCRKDLA